MISFFRHIFFVFLYPGYSDFLRNIGKITGNRRTEQVGGHHDLELGACELDDLGSAGYTVRAGIADGVNDTATTAALHSLS